MAVARSSSIQGRARRAAAGAAPEQEQEVGRPTALSARRASERRTPVDFNSHRVRVLLLSFCTLLLSTCASVRCLLTVVLYYVYPHFLFSRRVARGSPRVEGRSSTRYARPLTLTPRPARALSYPQSPVIRSSCTCPFPPSRPVPSPWRCLKQAQREPPPLLYD